MIIYNNSNAYSNTATGIIIIIIIVVFNTLILFYHNIIIILCYYAVAGTRFFFSLDDLNVNHTWALHHTFKTTHALIIIIIITRVTYFIRIYNISLQRSLCTTTRPCTDTEIDIGDFRNYIISLDKRLFMAQSNSLCFLI